MSLRIRTTCSLFLSGILLLASACKSSAPAVAPEEKTTPADSSVKSLPPASVSEATPRPSGSIRFTDVTAPAGIHFHHHSGAFGQKYLPETMGSGVCALDYDNDGWQDILFVNSMDWRGHESGTRSYPALYHNNHDGTFTDVTQQAGLAVQVYGLGCAVADFDNDGREDIYITALDGNHLFHNQRDGKFIDVTAKSGVRDPGFATGAVWFDYDNDGKLDLFVSHYVQWSLETDQKCSLDGKHKSYCTPELYKGESATLFHNLGNGRFEDVTKKAGLYDPSSKSLGVALIDYDNDGWLDLFVANDTQANKLYHNNHNGTFTDEAFASGVAFSDAGKARAGMGADAADYDLSGHQGLVIGNFANEGIALYKNDGSGLFADNAATDGIGPASLSSLTFSTFFFDYDLDGLPDILAANGHVADDVSVNTPSLHYAEPPLLFHNKGNGKFEDVTAKVGPALRQPVVGRGAAYLDYDNDGDLDLVMTTSNGPAKLFRNENGNQNDVLRVKTIGTKSNRDGIGAKIIVRNSRGQKLFAMVKDGSSYLSQSELPVTFGLGKPDADKPVTLEIVWPSGKRETVKNIEPNQSITLEEGKGMTAAEPIHFAALPKAGQR
ncbi:CRTAC1 family protein [Silvibacterium acidisoli]|uniref:CRTAC1 family protein n=1 Tax=Acidobacteriaceae bacterium ZG23-2 TaxID=2883246 RepID=UPI00406CC6C1